MMNPDPQTGGLFGFLNRMRKTNPTTGLNPIQNFAQALDPLILPSMRGGEAIRQQGLQRVAEGNRNATVAFLQMKANEGDKIAAQLLPAIQNRSIPMKDAMSFYYNATFKPQKDTSAIQNYEYAKNVLGLPEEEARKFGASAPLVDMSARPEAAAMVEAGYNFTNEIFNNAKNARNTLNTIQRQIQLSQSEDFQSGIGQDFFNAAKKWAQRFGFGDANVSSNEEFGALVKQTVLDALGGSLGVGVSQSDVEYLDAMRANQNFNPKTIRSMLFAQERLEKRKIDIRNFANTYMKSERNKGKPYIVDRFDFEMAVDEHFADQPLFGGLYME